MITEAIILAGGLGTRLKEAVPELPKCMAPVGGRPFIAYVIDHFVAQGVTDFVFALGYRSDAFHSFLSGFPGIRYQLSVEHEPLGTGGAIQLACQLVKGSQVFATNGDTLFKADLAALSGFHESHRAECTLCLKPMRDFERYGAVELAADGTITSFKEKQYFSEGYINAGMYALDKNAFLRRQRPLKFSFEKEYMETEYQKGRIYGMVQDAYFIDIGIPEDYARAQQELAGK